MSHHDFLIELGTEELPPKALHGLEKAFAEGVRAQLARAALTHGEIHSYATPRRLALWVKRLNAQQPDQDIRRRGPALAQAFDAAGAPTRAALAFAHSCGAALESLERIDEGKGPALFFIGSKPGSAATALLPEIVRSALDGLPIPKRMRWGASEAQFVRPVHWLVMLYADEVVPAQILGVNSGRSTQGHRFHAPKPLRVSSPGSYAKMLRERGYVIADFAERRARIAEQVNALGSEVACRALIDEQLLDEVTALVEWPVAIAARFEARFLELPRDVLISTLQDHQRYFPLEDAAGNLVAGFIAVANIASRDPDKVRAGNERVVRPRLSDAAFFWAQDRRRTLASRLPELDRVTFQTRLGSLGDKVRRVRVLAGEVAAALGSDRGAAERAAELSKCDLVTAMVGEFPELQGIMGEHYARADGEPEGVAAAIREHYLPRGAGDAVAQCAAGVAVAIADRIDTLTGIFAIDQKPSGTKDPFGLRRAALGVARTLLERSLPLDVHALIGKAAALQPLPAAGAVEPVYEYTMERLRAYYLEGASGITTEMFDAVLATHPQAPLDFDARLRALRAFLELPEARSLTSANKRIANILRKVEGEIAAEVDIDALKAPAEIKLYDALRAKQDVVQSGTAQREYTAALGHLAQLRPVIDGFFDDVMVMDEDLVVRANRLALLAQLSRLFGGIADLSRLPG